MRFLNSNLVTWIGFMILLGAYLLAFLVGLAENSLRWLNLLNEMGGRKKVFKQFLVAALVGADLLLYRQGYLGARIRNWNLGVILLSIGLVLFFPIYHPWMEKKLIGNPEYKPPKTRQIIFRLILFFLISLTIQMYYFVLRAN